MHLSRLIGLLVGNYVPARLLHDMQPPIRQFQDAVVFSSEWHILGPFQIGTREATWGADPLELLGGFRALEYDPKAEFKSSLAANGTVTWSRYTLSDTENGSKACLKIEFPQIEWTAIQAVYGLAALQYQAWARGSITVRGNQQQTLLLYSDHVLEFWVDDEPYFGGDYYAYRNAPLVLPLPPGEHRLDVRLVRDVRVMGAVGQPTINVKLEVKLASGGLVLADKVLISDVVDGRLASPYCSVTVRNEGIVPVEVIMIDSLTGSPSVLPISDFPVLLAPGQTRPIGFRVTLSDATVPSFLFGLFYRNLYDGSGSDTLTVRVPLVSVSKLDAHRVTFLHPGGIVSYAILRPPAMNATKEAGSTEAFPILLNLHGAGLEASSDLVRHSLDEVGEIPAWILFPTGVTPWSGDDWHDWGFADVEAAIAAIPPWIDAVRWDGPGAQTDRWLVSGHSNGGQGTWYALTHRPDNIIAAAPVSAYASIQSYVPYNLWHAADPQRSAIVQASMNSFRYELLIGNVKGIATFLQHGNADDNVPVYQSRRMYQLISEAGARSEYFEIARAGHWFDGVMTTQALKTFYKKSLRDAPWKAATFSNFSVVTANPGDTSPKFGVLIEQLVDPGRYGRVDVSMIPIDAAQHVINFRTTNIRSFRSVAAEESMSAVVVDGKEIPRHEFPPVGEPVVFVRAEEGLWSIKSRVWGELNNLTVAERQRGQFGGLNAILRTRAYYLVVATSTHTMKVAAQISRNLFQYFKADSVILSNPVQISRRSGNVITIVTGSVLPLPSLPSFPIQISGADKLAIRDDAGQNRIYGAEDGLAAIFVRPLDLERLELVIWGGDADSLRIAARLVPMLTGVGQPDFIVLSKSCSWKGLDGVLAMGFFDYSWNVSKTSYFS